MKYPAKVAEEAVRRGAIQHPGELGLFLELMDERVCERAIEVGVALGGTFWALSELGFKRMAGVDADLSHLRDDNRDIDGAVFIESESRDPNTVAAVRSYLGGPADLIFIDADHTPEAVLADAATWAPLLAVDGIMAFHDIAEQTARAWETLRQGREVEEFILPREREQMGIGVIWPE